METLSHHDLLALNNAIGEIYTARDVATFCASAFNCIREMIPNEYCTFNDISLAPLRFSRVISSSQDRDNVIQKNLQVLNAHAHEHPLAPQFACGHVFKTSDILSINQFKATALYNEYYRYLDIETQIGFSIPIALEKVKIVALNRNTTDFSERDRLLLATLKPHFIHALQNVTDLDRVTRERDLLQRGVEAEDKGVILLQSNGMILCISSLAKEFSGKYFHAYLAEGDTLPETLLQWFYTEINPYRKMRAAAEFSMRVERDPLVLEKEGKILKIKLFSDLATGTYIVCLAESVISPPLHNMRGYGLSSRETDVLHWIAEGKTNGEIAIILSTSKRTVDKHIEHIFAKLGVETRGAAAAIMRK